MVENVILIFFQILVFFFLRQFNVKSVRMISLGAPLTSFHCYRYYSGSLVTTRSSTRRRTCATVPDGCSCKHVVFCRFFEKTYWNVFAVSVVSSVRDPFRGHCVRRWRPPLREREEKWTRPFVQRKSTRTCTRIHYNIFLRICMRYVYTV